MTKLYKNNVQIGKTQKTLITVNYEQEKQTDAKTVDSIHHIHILDRSGSMSGEIARLIENVKQTIKEMSDNDKVTIIWFASHNQCKVLVKNAAKDEKELFTLLDSIKSTVGATCFSTPMKETNEVIDDLKALNHNFSVTLFTDGDPVVPWSDEQEEKLVFAELKKMKDKVLAVNTIGYGYYYNQDFLRRIAAESEYGNAIHSSQISEYASIFHHNYERISDLVTDSAELKAQVGVDILYLNSTSTKLSSSGYMKLNRLEKRKNQFFIIADGDFKFEFNGESFDTSNITTPVTESTLNNFYFAYAYELHYNGYRQKTLDIIANNIRDKYLIDKQLNAFTYNEVGEFRKEFRKAVIKPKTRYKNGQAPDGYLPREDALCVMDILGILSEGTNYYIPSKNYQRIGAEVKDNQNIFVANDEEVLSLFKDFTFNKKHMNVSIGFSVKGKVTINAKLAKNHNLPKEIDSNIFRTHTIIKDGNLNMQTIQTVLDQKTYDKFVALENDNSINFLSNVEKVDKGYRVEINLALFPTVNRTYVNDSDDLDHIVDSVEKITNLEIKQKAVGYYIKEIKSNNVESTLVGKYVGMTEDQMEILKAHGLDKNFTYGGLDNEKQETTDSYQSRVLEFTLKGYSTIPSVKDVQEKFANGKKLNAPGQVMNDYIIDLSKRMKAAGLNLGDDTIANKSFLESELEAIKSALFKERVKINSMKIAKVLTGDWFTGLHVDEKGIQTYTKNDKVLVVKADRVTIEI
ncbi:hypothetical protein D3C76_10930 [compost metagenome]